MVAVEPPPPARPPVDTHRVESLEELRKAFRVAAEAFGVDDELRSAFEKRAERLWPIERDGGAEATFVATIAGEIVGFAVAAFGRNAVFMRGSGTLPECRGRGVYRALVRARWDEAVTCGTAALTVGAGSLSKPILDRLGFSVVGWYDCLLDTVPA